MIFFFFFEDSNDVLSKKEPAFIRNFLKQKFHSVFQWALSTHLYV